MDKLTEQQRQGATVAGLQIASAVALFLSLGHAAGETPAEVREDFLQVCTELFDETASALSQPPQGAQLRPRAELLAKIDGLVNIGMKLGNGDGLQLLSALSEAAERIRADA